jgi:two-component system sensor histidine kinase AlgZ
VLQPLVENAVLHGVAMLHEGGTVQIALAVDDGLLRISIGNPAPPPRKGDDGSGARHAQRSIGDRLAYAFGARAGLTARHEEGYYRCEIRVPVMPGATT